MSEKVITVEKCENMNKVFYREKLVGVYVDGDTKSVAEVIDLALDECVERKAKQVENQLVPLVQRLMQECYKAGYNRRPAKQDGILTEIMDLFV